MGLEALWLSLPCCHFLSSGHPRPPQALFWDPIVALKQQTNHLWAGVSRREDKWSHYPLPGLGLRTDTGRDQLHLQDEGIRPGDCKSLTDLKFWDTNKNQKKNDQLRSLWRSVELVEVRNFWVRDRALSETPCWIEIKFVLGPSWHLAGEQDLEGWAWPLGQLAWMGSEKCGALRGRT